MEDIAITLDRVDKLLRRIPLSIDKFTGKEADEFLTAELTCQYIEALVMSIKNLVRVVERVVAKEKILSDHMHHQY